MEKRYVDKPERNLHAVCTICTLLALSALYLHSTCTTCTFVPKTCRVGGAAEDKQLREVDKAVTPTEKTISRYRHDAVAVQICCAGSAESAGSVQVVQTRSAGSADKKCRQCRHSADKMTVYLHT